MSIPFNDLSTRKVVWYNYPKVTSPIAGPFRVVGFYGDYEGRHVRVVNMTTGNERTILLADDDEYGLPCFYGKPPT